MQTDLQPQYYTTTQQAEEYNQISTQVQVRWAKNSLAKIDLAGKSVLDVGCGTGQITHAISQSAATVKGVDLSDKMIAVAKKNFPEIEFNQANATDLTEYTQSADVVTSFYCLHWIEDQKKALEEMYNALKPGGQIILNVPGGIPKFDDDTMKAKLMNFGRGMGEVYAKKQYKDAVSISANPVLTNESLKTMMQEIGFQNCKINAILEECTFTSKEQVALWAKSSFRQVQKLSPDLQEKLVEDITEVFEQVFPADNKGHIHCFGPKIEAIANK